MRKRLGLIFMIAALASLLMCVPVLADGTITAPAAAGIYNITAADGYRSSITLTPLTASGDAAITAATATIGGKAYADFYADAVRVKVDYAGATSGNYYLILALNDTATPTANNIGYIDQTTATGASVSFTVYPESLVSGKTYYIYLSGTDGTALTQIASFSYYAPYTLGDVDNDGKFTATDALYSLQMAVGKGTWTDNQKLAANVDNDTKITATDALYILQRAVGNRSSFGD